MSSSQNVVITQSRTLTTKVFQILPPVTGNKPRLGRNCVEKFVEKSRADKITCTPISETTDKWCHKREYVDPKCKRKPPPFPAFSDCLDEEMESILTECPLDREKYLRMQPRFMGISKKPFTLKPPPPIQGKIDILKEQQCLREKFCIENEGITQTCSDFGKPIPLMKTKKLVKEKNWDCQRMEELKRAGRWPPFTLRQNRRLCTSTSSRLVESCRNLSSIGLNSIPEISNENVNSTLKRIYIRDYHALVKSSSKSLLVDNEPKLKELTQKIFPDMDDPIKLLKLQNNQWRIMNLKNYELLSRQSNLTKRVKRFYSTYRTKYKSFLRSPTKGCTFKTHVIRRRVSNKARLFKNKISSFRGNRTLKSGRPNNNAKRERCQVQTNKKGHPKFTLNNGSSRGYKKGGYKKYGYKPFSPFPAFSEYKDELISRARELEEHTRNIQPGYNIFTESRTHIRQYPEQEKVDMCLGLEYYKCKNDLKNEGITLDCESMGFCAKEVDSGECGAKDNCNTECNSKTNIVEFFVQDHKKQKPVCYEETTTCCSQSKTKACKEKEQCEEDKKKLEDICIEHCLKCIPCHLPEEEKYCLCREECKKVYQTDCSKPKPVECEKKEESCKRKILKNKDCGLTKPPCRPPEPTCPPKPACPPEPTCCPKPPEETCCDEIKEDCPVKAVICKPKPCPPKKSKSFTQLENLWQRIVNYFKARPNCPEPGEWKKKALRAKAEKAAAAAGLVTLDPKCLPPSILRKPKVAKSDCKVCPNKDPCDKESDCETNKTVSSRFSRRNFSTVVQPSRNYSRSCENLEEINRLLDEAELKKRQRRYGSNSNFKKEFAIFSERKDNETSEALAMSLNTELYRPVDFSKLCHKNGRYPRTYFGYSDIIPSRENILERAWRISIESYNKYNCPKAYNFFNEFFNKMDKSIQSIEDLEKLKTENVLRELDEFLKDHEDPDKKKK